MKNYIVKSDNYAGWSSGGRDFGAVGLVAGAISLLCWATTRGYVHRLQPSDMSGQLFLSAMVWVGGGVFVLMAMAAFGSILISARSQGTATITDEGVRRQIGDRSMLLEWREIEGFVHVPYSGVTLVSHEGNRNMLIPRTVEDYRGCIAELKARNLQSLPSSRVRWQQQKLTWRGWVQTTVGTLLFALAYEAAFPHAARIAALCVWIAWLLWLMMKDRQLEDPGSFRWAGLVVIAGALVWLLYHMAHTW